MIHPNILIFLESLPSPQKEIVKAVREAILSTDPVISERIRFQKRGQPDTLEFLFRNPIAVFKLDREKVSLLYFYGAAFKDPQRLLKGSGNKSRTISFQSFSDVNPQAIKELTVQAVAYNNTYFQ